MEKFKEFQGKSLDEAILSACTYFDAPRGKLEIDIVQDAKNGIFGLVGARKALIRARRTASAAEVSTRLTRDTAKNSKTSSLSGASHEEQRTNRRRPSKERHDHVDRSERSEKAESSETRASGRHDSRGRNQGHNRHRTDKLDGHTARGSRRSPSWQRGENKQEVCGNVAVPVLSAEEMAAKEAAEDARAALLAGQIADINDFNASLDTDNDDVSEGFPEVLFDSLDHAKLQEEGTKAAQALVFSILGEVPITVRLANNRLEVHVECGEDSGLLIGREGQTLAALQYLASRVVSRSMNAPIRVQFDVGDYRERQDERLRELALLLAQRVRETGRPNSTRPMSSYHRRIVHLALQNETDLQTRSSGDGPLKRVVIQRRRADRRPYREG